MNHLFMEYDQILIGARKTISDYHFRGNNRHREANALSVIRYAFLRYLRWTPEQLIAHLDAKFMADMHLQDLVKYIQFPIEYDRDKDYFYLVTLIFPKMRLGIREKVIHTYECILNKTIKKYPKDYFMGSDGLIRAGICLQYMINHYVYFSNMNDLYHIFGCCEGLHYLRKYKLFNVCMDAFETPVDFLHFTLAPEQKNRFFHQYYRFKYLMEVINENGRKRTTTPNYKLEVKNI